MTAGFTRCGTCGEVAISPPPADLKCPECGGTDFKEISQSKMIEEKYIKQGAD